MRFSRATRTAFALGVAVAVLPLLAYRLPFLVAADEAFVVLSGSMEPTFGPGDIIYVDHVDPYTLREGDIITFHENLKGGRVFTHRIVEVVEDERGTLFRTKGDANEDVDPNLVHPSQVIAVHEFSVPGYGRVVASARGPTGFLLLIVMPAALIIVNEVRRIAVLLREERAKSKAMAPVVEFAVIPDPPDPFTRGRVCIVARPRGVGGGARP